MPRTWNLPQELQELKMCQEQYARVGQSPTKRRLAQFPMIVKPDQMSQGKGISLTFDVDKIDMREPVVVQEYLNEPLLLDGLKFDLRLYVLILSCDPLKIYIHKEGLVRFCTQEYKPIDCHTTQNELKNMYVHLTNYSLNKMNADFKQAESCEDRTSHKRTTTQVMEQLKEKGIDTSRIWEDMTDLITKTMICIQPELSHSYRMSQPADVENRMCFELLGFDIILNRQEKPILLEVNHAPSFATDSPLDYDVKRQLFVDMFTLIGLTIERKQQKLMQTYEEKISRLFTRLTKEQKIMKVRQILEQ